MGQHERISVICSKGSLDMAYPGLVLANAARMSGIEVKMFFTFWGLDIVNKEKVDHLHLSIVGNTSLPIPAMIAGLPGVEHLATAKMKREMQKLDLPTVREFLTTLSDSGAELYACQLAMDMFKVPRESLVPEVKDVISAMDFFDKTGTAQIIFI